MELRIYVHRVILFAIFVILMSLIGCNEDSVHPATQIEGIWGTQHIILVADKAGGVLEYDCAHGTIDQPLIPNADGSFFFRGTHTWEEGGPIHIDQKLDKQSARYYGSVSGNTLKLTIILVVDDQILGPYTLVQDDPGRVFKCL